MWRTKRNIVRKPTRLTSQISAALPAGWLAPWRQVLADRAIEERLGGLDMDKVMDEVTPRPEAPKQHESTAQPADALVDAAGARPEHPTHRRFGGLAGLAGLRRRR